MLSKLRDFKKISGTHLAIFGALTHYDIIAAPSDGWSVVIDVQYLNSHRDVAHQTWIV